MLLGDLVLARGRAMLAQPEDADEAFQAVLAMEAGGVWPFYQARTELAYGEFLRILSLPVYSKMSDQDVDDVIDAVLEAARSHSL